jgi:ferrous iron transport protein A
MDGVTAPSEGQEKIGGSMPAAAPFPGGHGMGKQCSPEDVCYSDQNGRILNSDYSGRSFQVLPFRQPMGVQRLSVLSELNIGESGVLVALDLPESVQNHLMHMGFVPDARVTALRRAPAGDPTVYAIDGMEIALRHETAEAIRVRPCRADSASRGQHRRGRQRRHASPLVEPASIEAAQ